MKAAESQKPKAHLDLCEVDLPYGGRLEAEAAAVPLQRDDVLRGRRRRIRDDLAALQPGIEQPSAERVKR